MDKSMSINDYLGPWVWEDDSWKRRWLEPSDEYAKYGLAEYFGVGICLGPVRDPESGEKFDEWTIFGKYHPENTEALYFKRLGEMSWDDAKVEAETCFLVNLDELLRRPKAA